MKKFNIILINLLVVFCSSCELRTVPKVVPITEDLYVKGISISSEGYRYTRQYRIYHIGTLLGKDTIFSIKGKELKGSDEPLEFKLGDKIIIKKENSINE